MSLITAIKLSLHTGGDYSVNRFYPSGLNYKADKSSYKTCRSLPSLNTFAIEMVAELDSPFL